MEKVKQMLKSFKERLEYRMPKWLQVFWGAAGLYNVVLAIVGLATTGPLILILNLVCGVVLIVGAVAAAMRDRKDVEKALEWMKRIND